MRNTLSFEDLETLRYFCDMFGIPFIVSEIASLNLDYGVSDMFTRYA